MSAVINNMDKIFNLSLVYATFRSASPIIFAALCAAITQQANILNVGTEGIMLVGAFTAVAVSYFSGSWILGVGAAMLAGALIAMIIGLQGTGNGITTIPGILLYIYSPHQLIMYIILAAATFASAFALAWLFVVPKEVMEE